MKARAGFVSNSSTSSFVILGFICKDRPEFETYEEEIEWENNKATWVDDKGVYIVGKVLTQSRDYELEDAQFTIGELQEEAQEIAEENGVDVGKIKLHMGTRPS